MAGVDSLSICVCCSISPRGKDLSLRKEENPEVGMSLSPFAQVEWIKKRSVRWLSPQMRSSERECKYVKEARHCI